MLTESEYCPACGSWDRPIIEEFGWCAQCVLEQYPEIRVCLSCSSPFPASSNRKYCSACKGEEWLSIHADQIEEYMAVGYSFTSAKQQVIHDVRPDCIICELPIIGGNSDALFCTRTKRCRSAQRRFKTDRKNGMSRQEAAKKAIKAGRGINGNVSAAA